MITIYGIKERAGPTPAKKPILRLRAFRPPLALLARKT
jgi:hypothetical protein